MGEPQRIGELLPGLMADIDRRMQDRDERRRRRIFEAVKDFHRGKSTRKRPTITDKQHRVKE